MPKGYWMVHVDVADADKFTAYAQANAAAFKKFGARFLVRGGQFEVTEGATRARNTLIEFPSYQAALDCWRSAEYQAARELRQGAATIDIVVSEGYDGPQPS